MPVTNTLYDEMEVGGGSTGGTGVNWRGTWNASTTYLVDDAVAYLGSSYIATAEHAGSPPPAAPWAVMAQAGGVGPQGPIGATGPTGPQGIQGIQGVQGVQGPQGPQGPIGPQGIQGPQGTGFLVQGSVNSSTNLPSQPQPTGDAYVTLDNGHLWVSDGAMWVDMGPFQGPAGPGGPQGPIGAQGPAGPQGAQGYPGPEGPMGPAGATGPQGSEGPRGPQGAPGDPYGSPVLAIGSIVHWRPSASSYDRYGLCKPGVVLAVIDEFHNLLDLHVLGTRDGPAHMQDEVPTGYQGGQWHYIVDCPYSFTLGSPGLLMAEPQLRNGHHVTFPATQPYVLGATP
jgi:hypothetical protein